MYCKKCGSILLLGVESCINCGEPAENKIREVIESVRKTDSNTSEVFSEEIDVREVIKENCRRCSNDKCFVTRMQILPGDEAETEIYQCTKCGYKWRWSDL